MGVNTNPGYLSGLFVKGHPESFNKLLLRQGQLVRLIHARKCPCIKSGYADLYCEICGGKGYKTFFQEECTMLEEYSPHGTEGDNSKIYPFYNPISKVRKVQTRNIDVQGGVTNYEVESFDDSSITLVDDESLPERHERLYVSYNFKNANAVTNENSTHDGTFTIKTTGTKWTTDHIPDVLEAHGDILSVTRVYNKTTSYSYTVESFKKNYIKLKSGAGIVAPQSTDVLEVDYEYIPLLYAALVGVETTNSIEKWGEDVKIGDIRIVLPGYYTIGKGSIITAMTTLLQAQEIIIRGTADYDELPSFDVLEVIGNITDSEGNVYDSNHFEIEEFNNLVWTTTTRPAQGKKYTVNYYYRPSYMVYRPQSKTVNLGKDARYPITTFGRFFNRVSTKDLDLI